MYFFFLFPLDTEGESAETSKKNKVFLKSVLENDLSLKRSNEPARKTYFSVHMGTWLLLKTDSTKPVMLVLSSFYFHVFNVWLNL